MRNVFLVFPNSIVLAEFIGSYEISHAEVNSRDLTLIGTLGDNQVTIAKENFKAVEILQNFEL